MRAIIVTGDRYANWDTWQPVVDSGIGTGNVVVIHGGANGIDSIASGQCNGDPYRSYVIVPAQWGRHGKAAGPKRNAAMLTMLTILGQHGYEIAVHAFHDSIAESKGTRDMVTQALRAGVRVWLHRTYSDPKELVGMPDES